VNAGSRPLRSAFASLRFAGTVACLAAMLACTASPAQAPAGPVPPEGLVGVDWTRYARDCTVVAGGSGLSTIVDSVQDVDVTGDGRAEALVVSRCDSPTSSWPQEVDVFDGTSPRQSPARIGRLLADDPEYPREVAVRVQDGRVVVDAVGLSENAATCCPDLVLHRVFAWTGTTFSLVDSASTRR
jgi:hypothetical protein